MSGRKVILLQRQMTYDYRKLVNDKYPDDKGDEIISIDLESTRKNRRLGPFRHFSGIKWVPFGVKCATFIP